jgi:Tetratricopeptide repeat
VALVALALDDVGLAVPLQEHLEAAGHQVLWSPPLAHGPEALGSDTTPDVIVLVEPMGRSLAPDLERWRQRDPPPALLAIVLGQAGRDAAAAAHVHVVAASSPPRAIAIAVDRALLTRWAGGLSRPYARGALGLIADPDPLRDAERIVAAARQVDFEVVREALRGYAAHYAAATKTIDELRERRALEIPEVELARTLDGAHTLKSVVRATSSMGAAHVGRVLWALACTGGLSLSIDPPDMATADRRAVAMARRHLRARQARLQQASHYDVLEVTPTAEPAEIDQAVRMLSVRFAPERTQSLDLSGAAALVAPLWKAVLEARAVLLDPASRLKHHDELRARPSLTSPWVVGPHDRERAEQAFARGQRALLDGEAFKAVSEMAAAARSHADHPDYECSLAWARYRAELARGNPREQAASRERASAEKALLGRRPWPRALVAVALLCTADGDPDSARWYLREALQCDPNHPTAQQLLARLGR